MRALLLLATIGIVLVTSASASDSPLTDEEQILALERAWAHALEAEDRGALERIVASDFTFIDPDGTELSRVAYLADRGDSPGEAHSVEVSEMRARTFGETALVAGLATVDESIAGKRYKYQLRWKELWIKRNGSWQVLAGQATPVNKAWNAPFVRDRDL